MYKKYNYNYPNKLDPNEQIHSGLKDPNCSNHRHTRPHNPRSCMLWPSLLATIRLPVSQCESMVFLIETSYLVQ